MKQTLTLSNWNL